MREVTGTSPCEYLAESESKNYSQTCCTFMESKKNEKLSIPPEAILISHQNLIMSVYQIQEMMRLNKSTENIGVSKVYLPIISTKFKLTQKIYGSKW